MIVTRRAQSSVRTCAGCRAEEARDALVRLAIVDEAPYVLPDAFRKLGGRGVSIHARRACLESAVRRGAVAKALGREDGPSPSMVISVGDLADGLAEQLVRRGRSLILSAVRRRTASLGTEASRDALARGRASLLVVAADAAGARGDLERLADASGVRARVFATKAALGALFGREELGFLTIDDAGIAAALDEVSAGVSALSEDG